MEKRGNAPREYHEKSDRFVRIDKVRTDEEKKQRKRLNSAAWLLENPRARWSAPPLSPP